MSAVKKFGSYSPGVEASQSGDDEAEDSIVIDYGAVTLTAAEARTLLDTENRKDDEGVGEIGEEVEALLAAFVATESADTFAFKWLQVEPPTADEDRPPVNFSLNFAKIEFDDRESVSRKEALLAAAELEAVLEEQLSTDLNVRVTGGGEAGMIVKLDDVLITSISTGGSGAEDAFLTGLADYDLLG